MFINQNNIQETKERKRWQKNDKANPEKNFKQIHRNEEPTWNSMTHITIMADHTNECEEWLDNFMVGVGRTCKVWKHKGHTEGM